MDIRVTSFEESERDIRSVRDAVFGEEQGVNRELDWDGGDPGCIHVVATESGGNAIGTGRMRPDGRIGRLAVLRGWRGRGVGAGMIEALVVSARRLGLARVYLHAQTHAIPFYERLGFEKDGPEFIEAGIPHVNMIKPC